LGVGIDSVTMSETLDAAEELVRARKPSYFVTPNVDVLVQLQTDREFKRIYDGASLVLADGMPLIWAGKFLGTPFKAKVSGSDLFVELCKRASEKGFSVYFMGAMPGVAAKAAAILEKRFPGLKVTGTHSPSFGFEKNEDECREIAAKIKTAKPDILFIGLGSPKQEKWTDRWIAEHQVPLSVMVGISFDYVAGTVKRAPAWMQKSGLEWLFRLCVEPKRLWKRYLVDDPKYFWYVLKQKTGSKR
jgi:N-acetylglucosaminyldiphosphoundecaprenol N-acetyl-beta-D-mannosaminyltransferase